MGNRATLQLVDNSGDFSPIIYVHWDGYRLESLTRKAAPMIRRDLGYAFARLVGIFHNATGGDGETLSLGVDTATEVQTWDSVGDCGHFQLNLDTGEFRNWGWGKSGPQDCKALPYVTFDQVHA